MDKILVEIASNTMSRCIAKMQSGNYTFIGGILQSMKITFDCSIPTLGVAFDSKNKQFILITNPSFFLSLKDDIERQAVLIHEIEHILHKHIFFMHENMQLDKNTLNLAQDIVINQLITGLPKIAFLPEMFKTKDGLLFKRGLPTETYYDLLKEEGTKVKKIKKQENGEECEEWVDIKDDILNTLDEHLFNEGVLSNEDIKNQLDEIKELVQRSINRHGMPSGIEGNRIKDLLKDLDRTVNKLNYEKLLRQAIRSTLISPNRIRTWKRPNRRYGEYAQGTKMGNAPKIDILVDTSGSLDYDMININLKLTADIVSVGGSKATLRLFHTQEYHVETIKKNFKLDPALLESGGTDLTEPLENAIKRGSELIVIMTDGEYPMPKIDKNIIPKNMVFIITENGKINHPLSNLGITVRYTK